MDDEELLPKAEQALTEIKVAQGLSERHEAVLAALRHPAEGERREVARGDARGGGRR